MNTYHVRQEPGAGENLNPGGVPLSSFDTQDDGAQAGLAGIREEPERKSLTNE